MNLMWIPLVGFLLGAQQPVPAAPAVSVPRIAVEDSAQVDPAQLRQIVDRYFSAGRRSGARARGCRCR